MQLALLDGWFVSPQPKHQKLGLFSTVTLCRTIHVPLMHNVWEDETIHPFPFGQKFKAKKFSVIDTSRRRIAITFNISLGKKVNKKYFSVFLSLIIAKATLKIKRINKKNAEKKKKRKTLRRFWCKPKCKCLLKNESAWKGYILNDGFWGTFWPNIQGRGRSIFECAEIICRDKINVRRKFASMTNAKSRI